MAELPKITLPELECAEVILPQPVNLSNFFSGLATLPGKLKALAQNLIED